MARSLTVISFLFQSTTHCRYRVYTKFLLTYTAMYRRNRKVLPLGITALQPQSHFHLGTPYTMVLISPFLINSQIYLYVDIKRFNNQRPSATHSCHLLHNFILGVVQNVFLILYISVVTIRTACFNVK